MIQTVEAVVDAIGQVRLLGVVIVDAPRRALVTVLEEPATVPGEAALLAEPTATVVTPAYLEKYAPMMARMEMTAKGMAAEYAQAIRVRPTKILAW